MFTARPCSSSSGVCDIVLKTYSICMSISMFVMSQAFAIARYDEEVQGSEVLLSLLPA